jgi:uncharacterized caspase-like protein
MDEAVRAFTRQAAAHPVRLFYFSGHGIQAGGQNYLIPIKAQIDSEADVPYAAVAAEWVLARLEESGQRLNLIILDACRNNPYARRWRTTTRGLERMREPRGSLVAYATAPGSVAEDGRARNGTFTKHLLRHLRTPGLGVRDLFFEVRVAVAQETEQKQVPWVSESLLEKFAFVPEAGGAAVSGGPTPAFQVQYEPRLGSLAITTQPDQTRLWLDGQALGSTRPGQAMVVADLPAGSHTLKVTKEGYQPWEQTVQVVAE